MVENKIIEQVDWEEYADTFPDRYLDHSRFDDEVKTVLDDLADDDELRVLDIGGGKNGTAYLDRPNTVVWLLDPNITGHPAWMQGNLSWDEAGGMTFGLIVARGCFNYFTPEQIKQLPAMLSPNGMLMFNTFCKPSTGERRYRNSKTGVTGTERYNYCPETQTIEHELEPDEQHVVIRHSFFVYALDEIIDMLGSEGMCARFLGKNSLLMSVVR